MKHLLHITLFTILLAGCVAAQSRTSLPQPRSDNAPKAVTTPQLEAGEVVLVGLQNSAGNCFTEMDRCFGNSFVLSGSSDPTSYVLTVSVDYKGLPDFISSHKISQGYWTLAVSQDGLYYGTIYGDVVEGKIEWSQNFPGGSPNRSTMSQLRILGGIDGYQGVATDGSVMNFSALTQFEGDSSITRGTLKTEF